MLELRRSAVRAQLADALAAVDRTLPLEVPVIVGSDLRTANGAAIDSTDPGDPDRLVARAAVATEQDLDGAIAEADRGLRDWSGRSSEERAAALLGAAAWMRERRLELAALEVRECAKPWPEADGDVCEAIDFLEYYARAGSSSTGADRSCRCPVNATSCDMCPVA